MMELFENSTKVGINIFKWLKQRKAFFPILIFWALFLGCDSKENKNFGDDISTDNGKIIEGRKSFELLCSSCHNFGQDAIGPNLSGLTRTVGSTWIKDFIKSPEKMIIESDDRATALMKKYKTVMPEFSSLSDTEVDAILAYLHTYEKVPLIRPDSLTAIQNSDWAVTVASISLRRPTGKSINFWKIEFLVLIPQFFSNPCQYQK